MPLRQRLIDYITGIDFELEGEVRPDTSLIRSGLLDSLALFKLALWIENEVRCPIDLTSLEINEVWDTPNDIIHFIEARRSVG
jgi:acyl carrier protein